MRSRWLHRVELVEGRLRMEGEEEDKLMSDYECGCGCGCGWKVIEEVQQYSTS